MSELPKGWAVIEIGRINTYKSETLDPSRHPEETFELYSVPTFPSRQPEILKGKEIGSTKQKVKPDDVLLCKINPRINRVWAVDEKAEHEQIASSEWIVLRQPQLDARFIRFQLRESDFRERLCGEVSGVGGSLTRAQPKKVEGYTLRIAPLAEQKRIAQKLDALLAQVDILKARIDAIPALLAHVRRSTLALVTVGTSSASATKSATAVEPTDFNQRAQITLGDEVLELPPGWTSAPLGSLIDPSRKLCYGVVQPGPEVESGIEMIRVCDINGGRIAWGELRRISEEVDSQYRRSRVAPGDILLSIVGSIGRAAIVRESRPANIARAVARLAADRSRVSSEWLWLWLTSPRVQWWLLSSSKEVARKTLNLKELSELPVPVPPKEVQDANVRRVEQIFALADQLDARVSAAQKRIDTLTQSLLAKAFRGELVPQDPNDEPASVLLDRIRTQRAAAPKPRRGRKAVAR